MSLTTEQEAELAAIANGNGDGHGYDPQTGERLEPLEQLRRLLAGLGVRSQRPPDPDKVDRRLVAVTKRGRQKAAYDLRLKDGTVIELGDAKKVLEPREARAAIFDATGDVMVLPKTADWVPIARLIHTVAVVQDTTMSDLDEARDWITSYIEDNAPGGCPEKIELDDKQALADALSGKRPTHVFKDSDGRLYLHRAHFARYVRFNERVGTKEIAERLGRLGLKRKQKAVRIGDKVHKQRLFVSDPGFDSEA